MPSLWHEHYFTRHGQELVDTDDDAAGVEGRFDAVEREPGKFWGYDAEDDTWYGPLESKEAAITWAQTRVQTWNAIDEGSFS